MSSDFTTEIKLALLKVAGPPGGVADSRERQLQRAADRIGITYAQAKKRFYGEVVDPKSRIAKQIRAAASGQLQGAQEYDAYQRLAQRVEKLERALLLRRADRARAMDRAARAKALRARRTLGQGV